MIKKVETCWSRNFYDCPPLAHLLRQKFTDKWVRFHSLPESKRYPESEAEYLEILSRHNVILKELFGNNINLCILLTEYSEKNKAKFLPEKIKKLFPSTENWCSTTYEDIYWHLHVANVYYTGSELDQLFRLVADDDQEAFNIMVIDLNGNSLFHPRAIALKNQQLPRLW